MRQEDRQQYLDMIPRVFVRAVRNPDSGDESYEHELSEGEATSLLIERESKLSVRVVRLEAALREIADHGKGPLGHVQNVTLLSCALAEIASRALEDERPASASAQPEPKGGET